METFELFYGTGVKPLDYFAHTSNEKNKKSYFIFYGRIYSQGCLGNRHFIYIQHISFFILINIFIKLLVI